MTSILDSLGRSVDIHWKASALCRWIVTPRIRKVLPPILHETALRAYMRGEFVDITEPIVLADVKLCLSSRVARRAIAAHLVKHKGLKRGEAMEALRRMGE